MVLFSTQGTLRSQNNDDEKEFVKIKPLFFTSCFPSGNHLIS